jgi:hypothetical protein
VRRVLEQICGEAGDGPRPAIGEPAVAICTS